MRGMPEFVFLALMSGTCDGGSSSSDQSSSGAFSCSDYQLMLDVEVELATECSTDEECTQELAGTGCGCATDDVVANGDFDTSYLFELWDEAEDAGCSMDFDTSCDCESDAEPACVSGHCAWR